MKDFMLSLFMILGFVLVVCNDTECDLIKVVNMLVFSVSALLWMLFSRTGRNYIKDLF
jgi:hypothetical protein